MATKAPVTPAPSSTSSTPDATRAHSLAHDAPADLAVGTQSLKRTALGGHSSQSPIVGSSAAAAHSWCTPMRLASGSRTATPTSGERDAGGRRVRAPAAQRPRARAEPAGHRVAGGRNL